MSKFKATLTFIFLGTVLGLLIAAFVNIKPYVVKVNEYAVVTATQDLPGLRLDYEVVGDKYKTVILYEEIVDAKSVNSDANTAAYTEGITATCRNKEADTVLMVVVSKDKAASAQAWSCATIG